MAIRITDLNFSSEVLECDIPVLVDFWAAWCPPCRMMESVIKELSAEYEQRVKVCKCNVDQNKSIAGKYNIRGVPCFIVFVNGEEKERVVGALSGDTLRAMMDKYIK